MLEIAKGVARDAAASKVFDIHFISDGGDFEPLIEKRGFTVTRMEPRLSPEKIEHIAKVDRGERFTPAFNDADAVHHDRALSEKKQRTKGKSRSLAENRFGMTTAGMGGYGRFSMTRRRASKAQSISSRPMMSGGAMRMTRSWVSLQRRPSCISASQ